MRTSINGEEAAWPEEIRSLWRERVVATAGVDFVEADVSRANFFTPREWRDDWNRGSNKTGFVYTHRDRVYFVEWLA